MINLLTTLSFSHQRNTNRTVEKRFGYSSSVSNTKANIKMSTFQYRVPLSRLTSFVYQLQVLE